MACSPSRSTTSPAPTTSGETAHRAGCRPIRDALADPRRRQRRARPLRRGRGPPRRAARPAARAAPRSPGLSYLRELHGDLDGARLAMLQAEQAAGDGPGRPRHDRRPSSATSSWPQRDLAGAADGYERAERASPGLLNTAIGLGPAEGGRRATSTGAIDTLAGVVDRTPTPAVSHAPGRAPAGRGRPKRRRGQLRPGARRHAAPRRGRLDRRPRVGHLRRRPRRPGGRRRLAQTGLRRAAHRVHRRRARLGADPCRSTAEALPYVEEALRLGTPSPVLHAHAAVAFAGAGTGRERSHRARSGPSPSSGWLVPALRADVAALADRSAFPCRRTGGRDVAGVALPRRRLRRCAALRSPSPPGSAERPSARQPHRQHLRRASSSGRTRWPSTTSSTWPSSRPCRPGSGSTPTATARSARPSRTPTAIVECATLAGGLTLDVDATTVTLSATGAPALPARAGRAAHAAARVRARRRRPRRSQGPHRLPMTATSPTGSAGGRSR